MMESIARNPFQIGVPGEQSEQIRLPFFILQLGPGGELIASSGGYYDLSDQEFLHDLIVKALSAPKSIGVLKEYGCGITEPIPISRTALCLLISPVETAALRAGEKLLPDCGGQLCGLSGREHLAFRLGRKAGGGGLEAAAPVCGGRLP